jgi:polysaccharide export outer membrane protein
MRSVFLIGLNIAGFILAQQVAIGAQKDRSDTATGAATAAPIGQSTGAAGDVMSLGLTGERRPLYRLCKSDVIQVSFTFSPEFDQTVTVQPDGYIVLKGVGSIFVESATLAEASNAVRGAYALMLHEPEVTLTLKDFEKPYFIATGEVGHPGKYELRSETTVTEAVAIAGGFTQQAKHSQVVLFRRVSEQFAETRVLNIKQALRARKLDEDVRLRPGDLVYVPQNQISKVRKFIPIPSLGMYYNPASF